MRYKSDPPLCSYSHGNCLLREDNVIPQAVLTVHHFRDIHLYQEHEVVVLFLNVTNRLGEAKPTDVSNVVHPQVEYHMMGRMALRRRRRLVQGGHRHAVSVR